MKKIIALLSALVLILGIGAFSVANAKDHPNNGHDRPAVCHPVGGRGNQHNGWTLIQPSQASSHIDESQYPNGHYWKHEADGRHDVYAVDGKCPSVVVVTEPPAPTPTGKPTDKPKDKPTPHVTKTPKAKPSPKPSTEPAPVPTVTPKNNVPQAVPDTGA